MEIHSEPLKISSSVNTLKETQVTLTREEHDKEYNGLIRVLMSHPGFKKLLL